ncbi:MAG: redoxin domain-containing protein [Rhodospirillales bacterium]|nr:redoxin domain-containing protein [Rhodospirillales bacterium]
MFGLRPAPELDRPGLEWFNVDRPLALSDLRGRLVILDFWTICCVNCINVQPTLRRIRASFPAEAVFVIGVHSPKFPAERDSAALAHALARYDIRHPVVHDRDLALWQAYGVLGWPTLVFIGPDGKVLGDLPGEPDCDKLLCGIGRMVRDCRPRAVVPAPLPCRPADAAADGGRALRRRLRYPSAIKPLPLSPFAGRDPDRRWWACADSGHHQVVLLADDGRETRRFGRGEPGFIDLAGEDSAFNNPQGLVCDCRFIYVADTGNHAIRKIEIASGAVSTVAGTGTRGGILTRTLPSHDVALASVWDLALRGDRLFFSNAGTHQLGVIDLKSGLLEPLAGTGSEELVDGPPEAAHLAQPSALALDDAATTLYFVDSEASAVRALDLGRGGEVRTLAGAGLFEFGHVNGPLATARFQHCLGIDWWCGRLIVADTYNGVLRVVDPLRGQVSDLGERAFGFDDGAFACSEPSGIAVAGPNRLLVSDTNNHRLVELRADRRTARTWA